MAPRFFCGKVSEEAEKLERVTRESFFEGIKFADANHRIGDISNAIQEYVEKNGFSVVRNYVGHGIGKNLHEDPEVPNFGRRGTGPLIKNGMTICIEPMINMGAQEIYIDEEDGWTVYTEDGSPSAQWEIQLVVTEDGYEILCW